MPPSAGACQTTEASENPDCGRAGDRSSIMTAITCCLAAAGETMTPSSGAATTTGVGSGVGVALVVGLPDSDGTTDAKALGVAMPAWLATGLPPGPRPNAPPRNAPPATIATTTSAAAARPAPRLGGPHRFRGRIE